MLLRAYNSVTKLFIFMMMFQIFIFHCHCIRWCLKDRALLVLKSTTIFGKPEFCKHAKFSLCEMPFFIYVSNVNEYFCLVSGGLWLSCPLPKLQMVLFFRKILKSNINSTKRGPKNEKKM